MYYDAIEEETLRQRNTGPRGKNRNWLNNEHIVLKMLTGIGLTMKPELV